MIEPKWNFIAIANALITRLVFAIHCIVGAWVVVGYYKNKLHYLILLGLIVLFAEGAYAIYVRKAKGYKWVSPCILIYLAIIIPIIWWMELFSIDQISEAKDQFAKKGGQGKAKQLPDGRWIVDAIHEEPFDSTGMVTVEQFLFFNLIVGRWLLPKGEMTRDEITRLLITYIGMSADNIGLFEAFREDVVKKNFALTISILAIVSIALLQFAFIVIAAKQRISLPTYADDDDDAFHKPDRDTVACCTAMEGTYICDQEVVSSIIVVCLQDLPFFIIRMLLIFNYGATGYMNMFFVGKNALGIMIVLYKLAGVWYDRRKAKNPKEYSEIKDQ